MHLTFSQLTVRIVLRELATHYGLEQDVFQTPTYKPFIKDTVFATVVGLVLGCRARRRGLSAN